MDTQSNTVAKILQDSLLKYKDLNRPNYGFVNDALDRQIYKPLIESLEAAGISSNEDTDTNYMVCRYLYFSNGNKMYSLYLSFIGEYGLLLTKEKRKFQCILETTPRLTDFEAIVLSTIRENQISLLDFDILETPVEFSAGRIVEYDIPKLFNLLFTDDIPPWE